MIHIDVIALEGFDEGLGDTVGLGRVGRGGTDQKPQRACKFAGLARGETGPIVGEPFDRVRRKEGRRTEAMLGADPFQWTV